MLCKGCSEPIKEGDTCLTCGMVYREDEPAKVEKLKVPLKEVATKKTAKRK